MPDITSHSWIKTFTWYEYVKIFSVFWILSTYFFGHLKSSVVVETPCISIFYISENSNRDFFLYSFNMMYIGNKAHLHNITIIFIFQSEIYMFIFDGLQRFNILRSIDFSDVQQTYYLPPHVGTYLTIKALVLCRKTIYFLI